VQRLGYGVDLASLTHEYSLLRSILIRDCLDAAIEQSSHEAFARLNEGLDEAILQAVRRYARGRDDVRDRFISILAHDLRNPLNTIAMAASRVLVGADTLDERMNRAASIIVRSTDRMARMIDQVVHVARAHLGGGIPLTLAPADLGELCQEAVDELVAGHPQRDLAIETHGDLNGFWDRDRVVQAMSNVIANALQHGQDPIRVIVREADDRQSITTTVSNAGRSPTREDIASMFDPFRAGSAGMARKGGLGLGLYIVRSIVRAHGGSVTVEPSDGEGFRLAIVWPRTPNDEMPHRGTSPDER
jgi:signal transduction histidine kinase